MADQFVQDDLALPLIPPGELGGTFQFGVLFFGKRLLEPSNHEVGVRFLSAYFKAERELYQQPALADETLVQIIHQYTNLPPHAIETSPLPTPVDGQIETDLLIKMQSYFMQQGYTEFARPIELDRMVDISYRDEALERLDAQSR
jgi:ABC-type nitrate/sulfonate/bicarbonate transport system substrate-binding protein